MLALVAVMPVFVEARHAASVTLQAQDIGSGATHDHGSDEGAPGDLAYHAQAHAQGVMPTTEGASTVRANAAMAFSVSDERERSPGRPPGLFKPPRA
ncbi:MULTISPECIES: hypothetical protein [unclassified Methylobacterium]|uniref:hypothetical protein n=1 Tax=unclassified Methylobacterium TaxID=2615210 RepID=UPI0011C88FA1|nr:MULTISPECIES: hypothetical protein [unclassified Methylobacterium]TXN41159.1 hypothetical protein FV225_03635 [Methylobacterium sp. WL93]TXN51437.1 hypothetical protein FV227_07495 [Methylobacterium sp. WL119]TXN67695.1 hypothetical protein FV232_11200 [Methylobacterium sp. WL30]